MNLIRLIQCLTNRPLNTIIEIQPIQTNNNMINDIPLYNDNYAQNYPQVNGCRPFLNNNYNNSPSNEMLYLNLRNNNINNI